VPVPKSTPCRLIPPAGAGWRASPRCPRFTVGAGKSLSGGRLSGVTCDPTITIDEAVAASEQRTGFRNRALANYMRAFGVLKNPVDYTLGVYFHHCAIAMSCRQLALAGRYLVHHGRNPATKGSVVSAERARRINALMLTCGHYDGSGEFAYRVGLPGKSGVGAGILAIVPGKASVAVWPLGLDPDGNSHLCALSVAGIACQRGGKRLRSGVVQSPRLSAAGSRKSVRAESN
jgi:glutaminase